MEKSNTIFLDIETQHTFEELRMFSRRDKNPLNLRMSIGGILYDIDNSIPKHRFFGESQVNQLLEELEKADLIINHNGFRFDYIVLEQYTKENLRNKFYNKTFDTMLELQKYTDGCWTSLDNLAQLNLGTQKTYDSSKIPKMWRDGKYKEVEEHLLNDLKLTRDIYNYIKKNKKMKYTHKEFGRVIGDREVEVEW